jgi:hypothetical protein
MNPASFWRGLPSRELRNGFTKGEVAKLLSRPQSFISKSESGGRRVDFVELLHLAKIYRKPISFFESHGRSPIAHFRNCFHVVFLVHCFRGCIGCLRNSNAIDDWRPACC